MYYLFLFYFSQFKGLAGLLSPGLLMSHIPLGWKVHDGHTFMPDSWYKFSARAPWFSSLWSLMLQYTSLAFLYGGLREISKSENTATEDVLRPQL